MVYLFINDIKVDSLVDKYEVYLNMDYKINYIKWFIEILVILGMKYN